MCGRFCVRVVRREGFPQSERAKPANGWRQEGRQPRETRGQRGREAAAHKNPRVAGHRSPEARSACEGATVGSGGGREGRGPPAALEGAGGAPRTTTDRGGAPVKRAAARAPEHITTWARQGRSHNAVSRQEKALDRSPLALPRSGWVRAERAGDVSERV